MAKRGLKIEQIDIGRLRPNPRNPRVNDQAVDAVIRSIEAFGFNNPIITDGRLKIAAGHTRLKAAEKLGMTQVPVIRIPGLQGDKFTGYSIADNQTAQLAEWDAELLATLIMQLNQTDDFLMDALGFDDRQLTLLLKAAAGEEKKSAEYVPPLPKKPVTKTGNLWLLGDHRLLCGDATEKRHVGRLLDGAKPFMMVTDPPYGVKYDPEWRIKYDWGKRHAVGKIDNDDRMDWTQAYMLFPGGVVYVWHAGVYTSAVADHLAACQLYIRAQIIWAKQNQVFGRGAYHWQHEPCWYAVRKGLGAKWTGDRKQTTVWRIENANPMGGKKDDENTWHATQKPLECMARPIGNHGKPGDLIYDPFVGSGTTIIACQQLGRRCLAIDLDPAYCDVTVERWEHFTGEKAQRKTSAAKVHKKAS